LKKAIQKPTAKGSSGSNNEIVSRVGVHNKVYNNRPPPLNPPP